MKELIEELKLNRVAYLLEIMEKKDFDSKINALKKLEKMKITPNIGLFLIQNSTKNYGVNDNNGGLNASILSLCFKNYYDVYTDAIEKVYKNLLPNVQNKVVYLLTTVDSESALKLYVDLVLKNYKNSDFIPISNLFERPYLYDYLFPKLYKALKFKNAKNNILILLNDYLAAGIVPVEDLKKNKKIICDALMRVFNIALKTNFKNTFDALNDEEYINLRFFLEICINIESFVSNKETSEALEKLLNKKDNQLKLFIIDNYYKKNKEVKKSTIEQISKDKYSRYALYEMLSIYDKVDIMKDKYKEASTIAESDFSINFGIYCNYKDDPKNIKYIDKINVNGFDYYVFKFSLTYTYNSSSEFLTNYIFNMVGMEKYNGKEITSEFIGISGGYDPNSKLHIVTKKLNKFLFTKINDKDDIVLVAQKLILDETKAVETKKTKIKNKISRELNKLKEKEKQIEEAKKVKIKKVEVKEEPIKEEIKEKNEEISQVKEITKESSKISNLFTHLLLSLFAIFIIMLISCMFFVTNFSGIGNIQNQDSVSVKAVKLNKDYKYTLIDGKEIFNEPESEYYVLLYKKDGDKSKYYTYINEYAKYDKKFYFVDLNDKKNKFLFEKNDLNFTVNGDRLLKVKDKEYDYFVNGKNNILKEMKNDINSLSKNQSTKK